MELGVSGKVMMVTGAASGIGKAVVELLASSGARLAICDINREGLDATSRSVAARGVETLAIPLDVSLPDQCKVAVKTATDQYGRIDALLHFAGIVDRRGIEETTVETWNKTIGVNLLGTFLMVQAVVPVMRTQGGGRIVLTASDSARKGASTSGPAYAASKGGVIALTRDCALKLGSSQIAVNAVCPGVIVTPMGETASRKTVEEISRRTPLGRLGHPDEVASVAVFLASDGAKWINGEVIEINGGFFFD
jgi:NAD(P)-dependent dehydrogenase (short-subunit alcohol dehydrogenase family)